MARPCTLCIHPQKDEIDAALVAGEPKASIARRFAVSRDSAERHASAHLPAALEKAQQACEVSSADSLLGQLRNLHQKTLGLLARAEKARQLRVAISAVREARENIELLSKLAERLGGQQQKVLVEYVNDWKDLPMGTGGRFQ